MSSAIKIRTAARVGSSSTAAGRRGGVHVGLGEARYRNLETYSAGMKQRAKLAQAIVHDPALLLLDEPTNGMDPPGRIEMLELVGDLAHHKGMSVILCSHLLKDVEEVAKEIIVMGNGRVLSRRMQVDAREGEPAVYSVRVRGDREVFARALRELGAEPLDGGLGVNLLVQIPPGCDPGLFYRAAAEADCILQRLEERTEKLEDVFVKAIGELGHAHL